MPTTEVIEAPAPPAEPEGLYEVVDGRFVEKPPRGVYESWVSRLLVRALLRDEGVSRLGSAVFEMMFELRPAVDRQRRPDVAFVSFDRWPPDRPIPRGRAWAVVPDLAVEIVSPTNAASDMMAKVEEYFLAGSRLVWVVYPEQRKVYAYGSPTNVRILAEGDDLDGGEVLPGFRLALRELFGEVGAA